MKAVSQLFLFAAIVVSFNFAQAAENCGGCGEVMIAASKIASVPETHRNMTRFLDDAIKAVEVMPTEAKRRLNANQIKAVTDLLVAAKGKDPSYAIIEANAPVFKANKNGFIQHFKKRETPIAQYLEDALGVALSNASNG